MKAIKKEQRNSTDQSACASAHLVGPIPDPEVVEKKPRRKFTIFD